MHCSTRKIIALILTASLMSLVVGLMPLSGGVQNYLQVFILSLTLLISVLMMGWNKLRPEHQNKFVTFMIILVAVIYQIVTLVVFGMELGFARNIYGWNIKTIMLIFLPLVLNISIMEILRRELIEKGKGSRLVVIVTTAALWIMMMANLMPAYNFSEARAVFTFGVTVAGPALLTNYLLSYVAYAYDYRANIAYRLIMEMPIYILPLTSNAGPFLTALFEIILVLGLIMSLAGGAKRIEKPRFLRRKMLKRPLTDREKRALNLLKWSGAGVAVLGVATYVLLMSGLVKFYFLAVGSGSMEPNLYRGDMILIEKTNDYNEIDEGDILVYQHDETTIVHRVSEKIFEDGRYVFQTKGDNNASEDNWQVDEDDVIGVARGKIAAFGFPTLWFNEIFNSKN